MNRRQFLLASGSVAATAGLAGCSDVLGDDDGGLDDIGAWLPDPRQVDSDLDHYEFEATQPAALADALDDLFFESNARPDPRFGSVTSADVDTAINVGTQTGQGFDVYFGSFDEEWAETNLERDGYERVRSVDELTIYERGDSEAVGISSDLAIETTDNSGDPDAAQLVELVLDTESGEVTRYTEALSDMETLMNALPSGHSVEGGTFPRVEENAPEAGILERQVAQGRTETFEGREVEETEVLVFLDEGDIVERDIEEYVEESGEFAGFLNRPEYDIDGRTVTITGRTPV